MAKYYFRLALLVGSVIGFFWIVGALLPRSYDFESSTTIQVAPGQVFPYINSLKRWPSWSRQWNTAEIEELQIHYNDILAGEGAAQTWTDRRGSGKLWIVGSEANQSIRYQMVFANFPEMSSRIRLEPTASEGTRVVWTSAGILPSGPFYGYFGSFFSTQMKNEYDKSLEKLKQVVEAAGSPANENAAVKPDDPAGKH